MTVEAMTDRRECGGDAAAFALGALADDEVPAFRAHLERCADCRDEVASFETVASILPTSAPQVGVPTAVKRRVMTEVRADARRRTAERRPRFAPRALFGRSAAGFAALASVAVLIVAVVLIASGGSSHREISATVAWHPGSATLRLGSGRSELIVRRMPQPPSGHVYEVWVQHGGGSPSPTSALFDVNSAGSAAVEVPGDLHGVRAVMVTAEPAGGSTKPTSPPVIVARL
jgi:anti-sigma-K factor RskA